MNDAAQKGRPKKAEQALSILEEFALCHWKGKGYMIVKNQALEIGSTQYKEYISRLFFLNYASGLTDNQLKEIISIQRGKAKFEASEKQVYFRTAAISETLTFIDLADEQGTIIKVNPAGWSIADKPDVIFFRPANIQPLPIPDKNGSIELFRKFLNLKNESDFILIKSILPFMLRGRPGNRGSYLATNFTGPEGSAKSTAAKMIKSIVDPCTPEIRTPGSDVRDLFIAACRCHVLNLDNISHITRDYSDALCSIITGGGFARKLNYSDDEEMVFENCNPLLLNGITFKTAPDLMSRLIQIELESISDEQRKTEAELWEEFEKAKPEILGGVLTALSNALGEYEKNFNTPPLPRLADFGKFTIALERGNGWTEGATLEALKENYNSGLDGISEENPLFTILFDEVYRTEKKRISGTAADILKILNEKADDKLQRLEIWPKTPAGLGSLLTRYINVLKSMGLIIERGTGKKRRDYVIKYVKSDENKVKLTEDEEKLLNLFPGDR